MLAWRRSSGGHHPPHHDVERGQGKHHGAVHAAALALGHMARRHGLLIFVSICVLLMLLASRGLRDALKGMAGGDEELTSAGGGATTCRGKLARIGIELSEIMAGPILYHPHHFPRDWNIFTHSHLYTLKQGGIPDLATLLQGSMLT